MLQDTRLHAIKTVHTVVWAFFVGSIAAVPIAAWAGRFNWALGFAGIVFAEVLVLFGILFSLARWMGWIR